MEVNSQWIPFDVDNSRASLKRVAQVRASGIMASSHRRLRQLPKAWPSLALRKDHPQKVHPHSQDPILTCPWPSVLTLLPHVPNSPNSAGKLVNLSFEPCHLCSRFFQDLTPNGLSEALPPSPNRSNRFAPHCTLSITEMQCWIHAIQQACRWQAPFWAWGGEQWTSHGPIPIRTDSDNKHIITFSVGTLMPSSPPWCQPPEGVLSGFRGQEESPDLMKGLLRPIQWGERQAKASRKRRKNSKWKEHLV